MSEGGYLMKSEGSGQERAPGNLRPGPRPPGQAACPLTHAEMLPMIGSMSLDPRALPFQAKALCDLAR